MNHHKPSAWIVASISLIVLGGLALLPGSTMRSAAAQPPSTPAAPTEMQAIAATGDPVSIKKDAEGYTVWTYEYPGSWCVMYSRIRWPFNLGAQDPTDLSETTLDLTFAEQPYVLGPAGEPLYTNPTWAVALNGKPGAWTDGSFTGEWNVIGAVGTTPTRAKVPVEQPVPFDYTELIDGENNLWFQQQDFCNCSGLADCACTCYELSKLQLRARVELAVKSVSPAPDTRNVWPDQSKDSEIRVKFTTLVSPTTVNKETFQVYYFDKDVYKVYVEGEIKRISDVEFAFVPTTELLPGVQYVAQVWGEADAQADNHADWVQDLNGGPLEEGRLWTFWTLPDIQVTVKPVQVLEGMALVQGKPTVLRTFIRWDTPPGVFWKSGVPTVQIDDVILSWLPPGGTTWLSYSWRQDSANNPEFWKPTLTAETALHKREYREFTFKEESYSLLEKRRLQDSFNFFAFTPRELGVYQFKVDVIVKDNLGKEHPFPASAQGLVFVENTTFPVYMQAVAVGSAYGRTGTVNLSALVQNNLGQLRALYPVAKVNWPAAPSAMAYYSPTTTGWTVEWVNPPSWPYYFSELYLLREMNQLCIRTTGCRAMVGVPPKDWLNTPGNSQRESAPMGALVRADMFPLAKRYTVAHEIGHLAQIDDHYEGPSGNGFDVSESVVKNAEQGYTDFMTAEPEEIGDKYLWINNQHYTTLWQWVHGGIPPVVPLRVASADPLLVVDGIITPTTDAVTLLPWYQLAPGDYVAPTPGPYQIVFLDAAQQEIVSYTRSFTASGALAFFNFATPYPAATAKVQVRRAADNAVLAEVTPAATPPTLTLQAPAAVWSGPQPLGWDGGSSARYFAVDISTDGGATWVAQAFNLTDPTYTLQTTALPNTTQAFFRVAASDGLRTTTLVKGPFTIDNPPLVGYVEPPDGAGNVGIWTTVAAGFRDAMVSASVNSSTFTLTGGPFGSVRGNVAYDAATHTATFTPTIPLAYATRYTATLTTGVQGANGENLPVTRTWTFTTALDVAPPSPIALSPKDGAMNVPRNVVLAVAWDRALNASTLNTSTFVLATASGTSVSGVVTYDAAARTAAFTPAAALVTDTLYIATLKAGIASADSYTTTGDLHWAFTAGHATGDALAFTGGYADWGRDANGDGLYEQLVIRVGVQVTATGSYILRGTLADTDNGEITWAYITPTLTAGAHFLDLAFDGAAIGGHGVDGPYTLTDLTLTHMDGVTFQLLASTSQRDAYRTFAYTAARFPTPLRFGGLPDVRIIPGTTTLNAFNVRDYAHSMTRPSSQLTYTVMFNSQPAMSVTLQPSGELLLSPEPYWEGRTAVTVRATDGVNAVQATFQATVGWPVIVYLPMILRDPGAPVSRDGWLTFLKDDFEHESFGWGRSSWYSDLPPEPMRWYFWGQRDCRAYSGQYSAWAYGYSNDGPLPPCGATYPDMLGTMMYQTMPFNLKYAAKAEYSTKVWTNLAPGDRVCLKVATDAPDNNCEWVNYHDGVCRSGQTNGWEDLTLDLSNVPTLGNLLGKEQVCLAVVFQADAAETRPEGAYVDDVQLRVCPAGLTDYCAGPAQTVPTTPTLAAGNIGGYPESVSAAALAVDAAGRIYALWTGKLNPNFETYVFYSTSTDGVNWTPYQVLDYWNAHNLALAVDNTHQRVHAIYSDFTDGIQHRVISNGVPGAPVVVVPYRTYYLPSINLPSGGLGWPDIAVAEDLGDARLVWQEGYYLRTGPYTYAYHFRAWYADWNGMAWSAPQQKINDLDTSAVSIETTADGRAMMAWFQRWEQSAGNGTGPGDPIVARTAYGTELGSFPLRQATHALYPQPERDESILLAYSGGDDAFVLASDHLMWPGHSRAYRYLWKNGTWSEPVSVAGNTTGWASPVYVGAVANSALIRYVYTDNGTLKLRTETNGVLGTAQAVADYLSARGYTGSPLAYFTDKSGGLHLIVSGAKDGVGGFYYVRP